MLDKGDTAPDFELPDQAGEPIKLATLLDSGPAGAETRRIFGRPQADRVWARSCSLTTSEVGRRGARRRFCKYKLTHAQYDRGRWRADCS